MLDKAAGELAAMDTLSISLLKTGREKMEKESKGKPLGKEDSIMLTVYKPHSLFCFRIDPSRRAWVF